MKKDKLFAITVQVNEADYDMLVDHYRNTAADDRFGRPLAGIHGVVQWNEIADRNRRARERRCNRRGSNPTEHCGARRSQNGSGDARSAQLNSEWTCSKQH